MCSLMVHWWRAVGVLAYFHVATHSSFHVWLIIIWREASSRGTNSEGGRTCLSKAFYSSDYNKKHTFIVYHSFGLYCNIVCIVIHS